MQCNALNIKTVTKQVWFYFIRGVTRTRPGYAGRTNLQIVLILHTPKNPCLLRLIKLPKKYLPKFSYPKKPRNRKFQTPTNPSTIPVTWNPEYPPPPTRRRQRCVLVFVICTLLSWSQKQATLQLRSIPLELQLNSWIKTATDSCFDKQEKRF